jgi:ribosomal protein L33
MITLIDELEMEPIEKSTVDFTSTLTPNAHKTCVQSLSKSNYYSERYKNMTPDQRDARRERQRLYNTKPKRKEAMKLSLKKFKEVRKHTLHPQSISMENPLFVPKLVWPTAGVSGGHGSMAKSSSWDIPESSASPLYIPPPREETDDEGCHELLSGHLTPRSHVLSGQRHALLMRRNTMFECRIGSNTKSSKKDGDYMSEDRVNTNTPLPQSSMNNNGKYCFLIVLFR